MQKVAKDLTVVFQGDRPGTLAKATEAIAKAGINLDGYAEVEGTFHALTGDAVGTRRALEGAGFQVGGEREVLVMDAEDRPGVAAGIFRRIADADVNVDFSYVATNNRMVIGAANVKKLTELFAVADAGATRT
jgi:hypothetical protein